MKISLGFSPCPNDTFIFDALVNHKIDTEGLEFETVLEDVQTLNQGAISGKLDVTKISYAVLPLILDKYIVLSSGGALGKGVGPLLISSAAIESGTDISRMSVAIPGLNTTAHMLFSLAWPEAQHKVFKVFSEIEQSVINGDTDLGVIIHENRFTYAQKGLKKIMDLGEYWEAKTKAPIPLGGIVVRRGFDESFRKKIDRLIRTSVEFAFENYPALSSYVTMHSQEMEENVMRAHIDLYVNQFSVSLGDEGKIAVRQLLKVYASMHPEFRLPEIPVFS